MKTQQLTKPSQTQALETATQGQGFQTRPWGDRIQASPGGENSSHAQTASDNQAHLQRKLDSSRNLGHSFGQLQIQPKYSSRIQTKLTVSSPGDKYEQEADRVAEQVVARLDAPSQQAATQGQTVQRQDDEEQAQTKPLADTIQREGDDEEQAQTKPLADTIQRQEGEEEEQAQTKPLADTIQRQDDEEQAQTKPLADTIQREGQEEEEQAQTKPLTNTVQRHGGVPVGPAAPDIEASIKSKRGSGSPLDPVLQRQMSAAFGRDFSGVKVHNDSQSDMLNRSLHARAFTTGQDLFFKQGEYNPGTTEGKKLIAHELTHVVQQSGGQLQRKESNKIQRSSIAKNITPATEGIVQREDDEGGASSSQIAEASSMLSQAVGETEEKSSKNQAEYTETKTAAEETDSKVDADIAPATGLQEGAKEVSQDMSKIDEATKEKKAPPKKPTDSDKQNVENADKKLAEAESKLGLPVNKLPAMPSDAKTTEPSGKPPEVQTKLQTKVQTKADSTKSSVTPKSINSGPVVQRWFGSKLWNKAKSAASTSWSGVKSVASKAWNLAKAGFQKFVGWIGKAFGFIIKRIKTLVKKVEAKVMSIVFKAVGIEGPLKALKAELAKNRQEAPGAIVAENETLNQVAQVKPLLGMLPTLANKSGAKPGDSMQVSLKESGWDTTKRYGKLAFYEGTDAVVPAFKTSFWKKSAQQFSDIWKDDEKTKVLYGTGPGGVILKLLDTARTLCQKIGIFAGTAGIVTTVLGFLLPLFGVTAPLAPLAVKAGVFLTKVGFVVYAAAAAIGALISGARFIRALTYPPGSKERAMLRTQAWGDLKQSLLDAVSAAMNYGALSAGSMSRSLGGKGVREAGRIASKDGGQWAEVGKALAGKVFKDPNISAKIATQVAKQGVSQGSQFVIKQGVNVAEEATS